MISDIDQSRPGLRQDHPGTAVILIRAMGKFSFNALCVFIPRPSSQEQSRIPSTLISSRSNESMKLEFHFISKTKCLPSILICRTWHSIWALLTWGQSCTQCPSARRQRHDVSLSLLCFCEQIDEKVSGKQRETERQTERDRWWLNKYPLDSRCQFIFEAHCEFCRNGHR